jgi:hypothetical protein
MSSFAEMMSGSFDFLTFPICSSLSRHLSWSVSIDSLCHRFGAKCCSVCRFYLHSNLDRIPSYVPKRFLWHAIDCYIVCITRRPLTNGQSYPFRQVVDFEDQGLFEIQNEVNSCICYYIKDIWIKLTHYSIHSRGDYNGDHLRSRILESETMNWSRWELMMGRVTPRWIVQMPLLHFRLQKDFKNSFEWLTLESQGRVVIARFTSLFGVLRRLKQWTFPSLCWELRTQIIGMPCTSISGFCRLFHLCQIRIQ